MTGQRPSRHAEEDPRRGALPVAERRTDGGADRGAQLEELSVHAVIRPRGGRLGGSSVVAILALVALLAAGFGVLGGRPQPSLPGIAASLLPSLLANGTNAPAASPARTPSVTPASACGALPRDGPPGVMLTVGDHLMAGQVSAIDDPNATPGPHREPIEIPADATADLRIAAGACATSWHIAVWSPSDGQLYPVDVVSNPDRDPAVALQNEFSLVLAPFRTIIAEQLELHAELQVGDRDILARWPIRILPFDRPQPRLRISRNQVIPLVEGCDVVLTFGNGYEEPMACSDDLSAELPPATRVAPGTEMSLDFDGWSIGDTIAYCGSSLELAFVLRSAPGCEQHPPHGRFFHAPEAGDWTIALGACAINAGNRICGTWFVDLDTR